MRKSLLLCLSILSFLFASCKMTITNKNGNSDSNKVTITYETEHGVAPQKITLDKGYVLTLNEVAPISAKGYEFVGWYDGLQKAEANVYIAQKSVTLVAKWNYIECDNVSNVQVVGSSNKITVSWELPVQESYVGVKIEVCKYSDISKIISSEILADTKTFYEYESENYVPLYIVVYTLQLEGKSDGENLIAIPGDNIYYVSSTGVSGNDGLSYVKPFRDLSTAYSKINSINDGSSVYYIYLVNNVSENSSPYNGSLYNFNPTKSMNLTIEGLGTSLISIPAKAGRVFSIGTNMNLTCKNVKVCGGNTTNLEARNFGGGGFLVYGTLKLYDSSVESNKISTYGNKTTTSSKGAGICVDTGAYCELFNTNVINNSCYASCNEGSSSSYGGGVFNSGTFIMHGGKISGNTISAGNYSSGKGIYKSSGTVSLDSDVINDDD